MLKLKKKGKAIAKVLVQEFEVKDIETALKSNGGLLTYTAEQLGCPLEILKTQIKKSKYLRDVVFALREAMLDLAEDTLAWRMREKKDGICAMYVTKCLGKQRGWVEKPEKAGSTADKPIYIKISPVNPVDTKGLPGRPRKAYAEIKVLPVSTDICQVDEEIIDAEIL